MLSLKTLDLKMYVGSHFTREDGAVYVRAQSPIMESR